MSFRMRRLRRPLRQAFTLVEVVLVVAILAVVASLAAMRCGRAVEAARIQAAEADLATLQSAFLSPEHGYLRDMSGIPGFSPAYLRIANLYIATNLFGSKIVSGASRLAQTRGIRLDDGASPAQCQAEGRARSEVFTSWDETCRRGWRGPYVMARAAEFPAKDARRFRGDPTFEERHFFPRLEHLRLPDAFKDKAKASVYGFVGEPALLDPWGNPYVIQIPPPQAFTNVAEVSDQVRFAYGRLVSAGPNGILETPCFDVNSTNWWATTWSSRKRRLCRQAGLIDGVNRTERGDDLVLFFSRNDVDEGEEQ
ncbi:MAG: prepilin-type N-terminal cleavage/methylation domain-containing protein [Kiritimatiellia bacterium]